MALLVLSLGVGQDSVGLLYEIVKNPEFREEYGIDLNDFMVITAETGNEHKHTYLYRDYLESFCKANNIDYHIIPLNEGWHSGSWGGGLVPFYEKTTTVGSKVFKKTCTDNLKIKPIYRYLNWYVINKYSLLPEIFTSSGVKTQQKFRELDWSNGVSDSLWSRVFKKDGIKLYAQKYGKINMIIGIAAGEESRADIDNTGSKEAWFISSVRKIYPLIKMGLNRAGVQNLIKYHGEEVPMPSNCILCPFMSLQELLWLYRFENVWYWEWVKLEADKLERYKDLGNKNMGVWGEKTLPEVLVIATEKFGHWSDDELNEYKMSHGHCVKSKY